MNFLNKSLGDTIFKSFNYIMDEFEFESGTILNNVTVEYTTWGTPKYDDKGVICNAVIYCHGSSGNFNSLRKICPIASKNKALDCDEYFFISLSSLGTPGSLSPSTTGLFMDFPSYTIKDMVNFIRKFIKAKFNIIKILGVIGNSLGGFLALTWASSYPDEVEFIISLVSSYKTSGVNYASSKLMQMIIESDPNYLKGDNESLTRTLKLSAYLEFTSGFSREFYYNKTPLELDDLILEYGDDVVLDNIYDVKFRNDAALIYDLTNDLEKITSKVLIVAINQDRYFPPRFDAIPMSKLIKNSTLLIFDSDLGHIGSNEIEKIEDEIKEFLKS